MNSSNRPLPGALAWAAAGWVALFLLFPFFNRDRLRAGDIIAGTWVVERPRTKLAEATGGDVHASTPKELQATIESDLKRWAQLTRFVDDGDVPISNNWVENHIRPIALGRANWLFAGSLRAGKRAAAIMSLLHSARINGHEPYAYLKDVLQRFCDGKTKQELFDGAMSRNLLNA